MNFLAHVRAHFFISLIAIIALLAMVACGSSDQPPAAPQAESGSQAAPQAQAQPEPQPPAQPQTGADPGQAPDPVPTNTPPAPTISAVVGQGAIGVVPTPVPTATPAAVAEEPPAEQSISLLKVARGVPNSSSLDPALGGRTNFSWLEPMYEGMIFFDQYTDLRPMMATEWSTNEGLLGLDHSASGRRSLPQKLGNSDRRRRGPLPGPGAQA